jgi:hypothetical protein
MLPIPLKMTTSLELVKAISLLLEMIPTLKILSMRIQLTQMIN